MKLRYYEIENSSTSLIKSTNTNKTMIKKKNRLNLSYNKGSLMFKKDAHVNGLILRQKAYH